MNNLGLCSGRLSHNESALMDPQSRILLEQAGAALADANSVPDTATGPSTGTYVGVMHMEYIQHITGAQICN